MAGLLDTIAEAYMRNVGNPARQLVGGGVRGLLGFDPPEYADSLGMEAYRNAAAMGNAPGINAPVGAFKAAAKVVPEAAMFIGALAKTWDKASNAKAVQMEKAGKDAREIWRETGNLKGPDGKWRQEISDDAAKLRDYNYTPQEAFTNAMRNASVGDGDHVAALSMRPYADKTKKQLVDEYARTGGEIVDAVLAGNKELGMQLSANRSGLDAIFGAMRQRDFGPASVYLKHGELSQAYPDVYKLHTRITDEISPSLGAYLQGSPFMGEQIQLANKPRSSEGKSVMLHELQHAIQQREGFARGGSASEFASGPMFDVKARELAADLSRSLTGGVSAKPEEILASLKYGDPKELGSIAAKYGFGGLDEAVAFLKREDSKRTPFGQYQRLAGEAEARATQARMNMTPAERRATFPYDSFDVPVDQLIVRGLLAP